jgi:hypothetical protein
MAGSTAGAATAGSLTGSNSNTACTLVAGDIEGDSTVGNSVLADITAPAPSAFGAASMTGPRNWPFTNR